MNNSIKADAGCNVKKLPETYNGRKLGHNWSISWVADEINKGTLN